MKFVIALGLATVFCIASPAYAQPQDCNAVLRNGTFSYSNYRHNSYFMQVVYSNFLSSSYASSKTDTSLGLGIPIGEAVMGSLNYGENSYDAMKQQIQDTHFQRTTQSNETQTVLFSGDGPILSAWTDCIRNRGGGLAVRFESLNSTTATLIIEWLPQFSISKTSLTDPIRLPPGVTLANASNPRCFKKGTVIKQGVGCRSTIHLPDAWTSLPIVVNTSRGAQSAYLPPRLRLNNERAALSVPSYTVQLFRRGQDYTPTQTFTLSEPQRHDHWLIDESTVVPRVTKDWDNGRSGTNHCIKPEAVASPYQINYRFNFNSATHGGDGWTLQCTMTVTGEMKRTIWVADEVEHPAAPALKYQPPEPLFKVKN